jgi:hypothetical protein
MYRVLLCAIAAVPLSAQQYEPRDYLDLLKTTPGATIHDKVKALDAQGIRLSNTGPRKTNDRSTGAPPEQRRTPAFPLYVESQRSDREEKVQENVEAKRATPSSISIEAYGKGFSPESINSLYGAYGIPYSPFANRPNAFHRPQAAAPNGEFFGRFGATESRSGASSFGSSFPGSRSPYNAYVTNLPATPQTPAMPRFSSIPQN